GWSIFHVVYRGTVRDPLHADRRPTLLHCRTRIVRVPDLSRCSIRSSFWSYGHHYAVDRGDKFVIKHFFARNDPERPWSRDSHVRHQYTNRITVLPTSGRRGRRISWCL